MEEFDADKHPVYNLKKQLQLEINTDFTKTENLRKYIQQGLARIIKHTQELKKFYNPNIPHTNPIRIIADSICSEAIDLDDVAYIIDDYTYNRAIPLEDLFEDKKLKRKLD